MKREEATKVLKEIFDKCTLFDGEYLALMPSNAENIISHGYQLHLKVPLDDEARSCMDEILKKFDLALMYKAEKGLTVIYRPKSEKAVRS